MIKMQQPIYYNKSEMLYATGGELKPLHNPVL